MASTSVATGVRLRHQGCTSSISCIMSLRQRISRRTGTHIMCSRTLRKASRVSNSPRRMGATRRHRRRPRYPREAPTVHIPTIPPRNTTIPPAGTGGRMSGRTRLASSHMRCRATIRIPNKRTPARTTSRRCSTQCTTIARSRTLMQATTGMCRNKSTIQPRSTRRVSKWGTSPRSTRATSTRLMARSQERGRMGRTTRMRRVQLSCRTCVCLRPSSWAGICSTHST